MIIEYEQVIVKSRILFTLYLIPVTLGMVVKNALSLLHDSNDDFCEYGFRQRPLHVTKLRR